MSNYYSLWPGTQFKAPAWGTDADAIYTKVNCDEAQAPDGTAIAVYYDEDVEVVETEKRCTPCLTGKGRHTDLCRARQRDAAAFKEQCSR